MRLIDADALVVRWKAAMLHIGKDKSGLHPIGFEVVIEDVEKRPTIDVVPLVRGQWGNYEPYTDVYRCSHCKNTHRTCTKYCPHCGAKMKWMATLD